MIREMTKTKFIKNKKKIYKKKKKPNINNHNFTVANVLRVEERILLEFVNQNHETSGEKTLLDFLNRTRCLFSDISRLIDSRDLKSSTEKIERKLSRFLESYSFVTSVKLLTNS